MMRPRLYATPSRKLSKAAISAVTPSGDAVAATVRAAKVVVIVRLPPEGIVWGAGMNITVRRCVLHLIRKMAVPLFDAP